MFDCIDLECVIQLLASIKVPRNQR